MLSPIGPRHRSSDTINAIQASNLLALYFLSSRRTLEGSTHVATAVSLALRCGLHRLGVASSFPSPAPLAGGLSAYELAPPRDALEYGERVSAFWQTFYVDRCYAVALRTPALLTDAEGDDARTRIWTPWPLEPETYSSDVVAPIIDPPAPTIANFFDWKTMPCQLEQQTGKGFSLLAIRSKATALVERIIRDTSKWESLASTSGQMAAAPHFTLLEACVNTFPKTLLDIVAASVAAPIVRQNLIVAHSLAQLGRIELYRPFASGSNTVCVEAAQEIVKIVRQTESADYQHLDPIVGTCWYSAALVLVNEVERLTLHKQYYPHVATEVQRTVQSVVDELDVIIHGLSELLGPEGFGHATWPLTEFQFQHVAQLRPGLYYNRSASGSP